MWLVSHKVATQCSWWPKSRQSLSWGQVHSLGGSSHGKPQLLTTFSLQIVTLCLSCAVRELGYDLGRRAQYPHYHQDLSLNRLLHSTC